MKNCRGFLAALVAAVLFSFAPATSLAGTVTVPVVPNEPTSLARIEYAQGIWTIGNAGTLATVRALADSVAHQIKEGKNVCVAVQGTADVIPFPNGDLVARRLGYVTQLFAAAGVPENRMRQSLLTETPKGERYVRVWLYPAGFSSVTLEIPDVEEIENRLSAVERRLDAGEAGLAVARDEAWRAWEAIDKVVDLAVGVGGAYQSVPGAFGPATFAEVRFSPDPGLPLALVGHGGFGLLSGSPNWTVGGGVGVWGDRVGFSLRYERILYAPYQQQEVDGGVSQAYQAHGHVAAVSFDARLAGRLWLRAEGQVGSGYALEGDAATRGTLGGGAIGLAYTLF